MVRSLIFAGGSGQRMNSRLKPKQFIEINGKPILIYTLEQFEYHDEVDDIIVVCLNDWINRLKGMLNRYGIKKVSNIVSGGATGHDSIFNGLVALKEKADPDDIILIHDGVRPFIGEGLISLNIKAVNDYGNAITVESIRESVIKSIDGGIVNDVPTYNQIYVAKAPQSFYFEDIMKVYDQAQVDGFKSIDSAHLMNTYGKSMHMVESTKSNIKITEPADYYLFRALCKESENQQIFGI